MIQQYQEDIKNKKHQHYMLTIARDGEEPARSIIFYDSALEAAAVYESYQDWGFAKDFLTVTLYEPNGMIHKKVLKRLSGIEASFMRKNYIEMGEAILEIKNKLDKETYNDFVFKVAKIFAVDNKRFNEERFFEATESFK